MKPEVIGHSWEKIKSTIRATIKMGISRLFFQFGLSISRRTQTDDEWNKNPYSVHMEEYNNSEWTNGKLILHW